MELTDEMTTAFQLIENTTECLYITGKAGTGKTTFLQYVVENTHKNVIVAASTGIAAVNAGGVTLHSLFNIPLCVYNSKNRITGRMYPDKVELFKELDTLIIDEISMVRPDTLDYIDTKLRLYRMCDAPFGGVQLVMFGDLYQLPPVVKKEEKEILLNMYRGVYFFYAHVFFSEQGFKVIELNTVFRQTDSRFVEILNHIRLYRLTSRDINDLDAIRDRRESMRYDNGYIHICAYRRDAQRINQEMLGEPTHTFNAKFKGNFTEAAAPCDQVLALRVGARVMTLINDPSHRFYNGSMGIVQEITSDYVNVLLDNGCVVLINPFEWDMKGYETKNGKIKATNKGSCIQFPLTLAWAITIHKSQGLTFDKVSIHAKNLFASGQLYTALSRCKTMKGIVSESFIDYRCIIPNPELKAFETAIKANNNIFNKTTYRSMRIK